MKRRLGFLNGTGATRIPRELGGIQAPDLKERAPTHTRQTSPERDAALALGTLPSAHASNCPVSPAPLSLFIRACCLRSRRTPYKYPWQSLLPSSGHCKRPANCRQKLRARGGNVIAQAEDKEELGRCVIGLQASRA